MKRWLNRLQNIQQHINRTPKPKETLQHTSRTYHRISQKNNIGKINETSHNIPILTECDVLVVGSGPAGLAAAIAAARTGVDVVIVERYGCFGGTITTVGMETIAWYRYPGTHDATGIGTEMEKMAKMMGATRDWAYNDSQCLDTEMFKTIADKLIIESKVRPILHCMVCSTIVENKTIKGVITESKSGRSAIMAKVVIDATGDADVSHLAGATYEKIGESERMSLTTVFSVAGVDKKRFIEWTENNPSTYMDWGDDWNQHSNPETQKLKSPYVSFKTNNKTFNGSWSSITDNGDALNLNLVHMRGYDATNVMDLTNAEIQGRQEVLSAVEELKKLPGFESCSLRTISMNVGVRDSRKIVGRYCMTKDDVMNQGRHEDSIGIFPEFVDGYSVLMLPTNGHYFQVPYGCIVSDIDNLLTVGRCCAGDDISHAAMKNMMACTVTGQGGGVAAAVTVLNNSSTHQILIELIQKELMNQNVSIS